MLMFLLRPLVTLIMLVITIGRPHDLRPKFKPMRGLSSIFGKPGDYLTGGKMACAPKLYAGRMHVCAHRTLPCGTFLELKSPRTGKESWCVVMDRGPYGALLPDGTWVVKIRRSDHGKWRGILDITDVPAAELGHNGLEQIVATRMF